MPRHILLLTPQTPFPPDQGAPIRNFSFIRYLGSNSDYELSLLSFARPGESCENSPALAQLQNYCHQVILVPHPPARSRLTRLAELVRSRQPDLALRLSSPSFYATMTLLLRRVEFDVILCEALEMAPFVLSYFSSLPPGSKRPRLVLDEHNAEHRLQQRIYQHEGQAGFKRLPAALYSRLQAYRLAQYEARALRFFDRSIAVSEPDRAALQALPGVRAEIAVISNGLDLQEFTPGDASEDTAGTLVFTGTMDFRPNVDAVTWFAREIWPLIRQERPQARFIIVGRRPAAAVQSLNRLSGIEVTGAVEDARPYIRFSSLYVVPMRMGGGVRYKVLEALAMGKAVVTTTMGVEGIDLVAGQEALVVDSPADFARICLELLAQPDRRAALGRNGRSFVEQHFDWRKITPRLEQVIDHS